jgi:hypothetical protein
LFRADFLVFQFPLWWFGLPVIGHRAGNSDGVDWPLRSA